MENNHSNRSYGFSKEQRAASCIEAVAVGDAMGKMTEGYSPQEILSTYRGHITTFIKPIQPKSKYTWKYAEVTDDTLFTLLVAKSIIENKRVNQQDIIKRIRTHPIKGWPRWQDFYQVMHADESARRQFAVEGDRNGAPMRVSPIGIMDKPTKLEKIVHDVELACKMTHGTKSALSAACAMAAAISAAIEGWSKQEIMEIAIEASELGESLGVDDGKPRIGDRILIGMKVVEDFQGQGLASVLNRVLNPPGFQAWEGVPYALSMFYGLNSVKDVILEVANQGGDADSVASMAASLSAAFNPHTLPREWVDIVEEANNFHLSEIALNIIRLRQ
jgi:ADP-ribosylglycohydrolase